MVGRPQCITVWLSWSPNARGSLRTSVSAMSSCDIEDDEDLRHNSRLCGPRSVVAFSVLRSGVRRGVAQHRQRRRLARRLRQMGPNVRELETGLGG